jgi:glycosidase
MKGSRFLLVCFGFLVACHHTTPQPVSSGAPPVVTQYGTPFGNVPAPSDAIIYQVNIRAFSAQGNFAGVEARLDSIKALGANVVYLMPIYPIGILKSVNSPYCVRDYGSVNPEFGTLTDLRTIVDGCHSRNMAVMLDWVANHTSWDHPWITSDPLWYLHDAGGNIISPPNTGFTDVAQLDFTNSAMRAEMIKSMKYWVLAANVDGFRCDFADNPPADFWAQAIDTLRNITTHKLLLLAEGSRSANYSAGFNYNFGFNFYGALKSIFSGHPVSQVDNLNTNDYAGASGDQQIVRYITNHDVNGSDGSPITLFGGKSGSMAAFVMAAYMKAVPFVYNGQEVGTPFSIPFPFTTVKINWSLNPDVTAEYKKVIAYRSTHDVIRTGQLLSYSSADVCAFTKTLGGNSVAVLINLRNTTVNFTLPAGLANTGWTYGFRSDSTVNLGTQVALPAYSYSVLESQ